MAPFSLFLSSLDLKVEFIVYSRERGFCCIVHHNTNVITYTSKHFVELCLESYAIDTFFSLVGCGVVSGKREAKMGGN